MSTNWVYAEKMFSLWGLDALQLRNSTLDQYFYGAKGLHRVELAELGAATSHLLNYFKYDQKMALWQGRKYNYIQSEKRNSFIHSFSL